MAAAQKQAGLKLMGALPLMLQERRGESPAWRHSGNGLGLKNAKAGGP